RRGHLDAAVELELADGEIGHLRPDEAEVENLGAGVGSAAHDGVGHRRGREPHVAPDGDPARLELVDVRTANGVSAGLVELILIDPADVVCLEGFWVEHGADGTERAADWPASPASKMPSST